MTQTALWSPMRNLGGSIGISIVEARHTRNIQVVLLARAPHLAAPFSLTTANRLSLSAKALALEER